MSEPDQLNLAERSAPTTSPSETRILDAARKIYNSNPVLPLPLSAVAEEAGVSRALIYSHFPDQYQLLAAMIGEQVDDIRADVRRALAGDASFLETVQRLGQILNEHFVQNGLLLANATQDDFLHGHLPGAFQSFLNHCLRKLARKAVAEFGFANRQAIASILLLAVIPEQAARLVRNGQISEATGARGVKRAVRISVGTFASG